jgi:sarcosine oxidase/L-pipecolate oxidase
MQSAHSIEKFLPIIGDLIRARFEDTLDPHLKKKWRITRTPAAEDPARTGMKRKPLDLKTLVRKQELVDGAVLRG